jgi:hypothetical protein
MAAEKGLGDGAPPPATAAAPPASPSLPPALPAFLAGMSLRGAPMVASEGGAPAPSAPPVDADSDPEEAPMGDEPA